MFNVKCFLVGKTVQSTTKLLLKALIKFMNKDKYIKNLFEQKVKIDLKRFQKQNKINGDHIFIL